MAPPILGELDIQDTSGTVTRIKLNENGDSAHILVGGNGRDADVILKDSLENDRIHIGVTKIGTPPNDKSLWAVSVMNSSNEPVALITEDGIEVISNENRAGYFKIVKSKNKSAAVEASNTGSGDGVVGHAKVKDKSGVYGDTNDEKGYGVFGKSLKYGNTGALGAIAKEVSSEDFPNAMDDAFPKGTPAGVYGKSNENIFGIGVAGISHGGPGVYGESIKTTIVVTKPDGNQDTFTSESSGVHGKTINSTGVSGHSTFGTGVTGFSLQGSGVEGSTLNGIGVGGSSSNNIGVNGTSSNNIAVHGEGPIAVQGNGTTAPEIGILGQGFMAGFFMGNVLVTDHLWANDKNFRIDHPLYPETKYLIHTSVESNERVNIYNGRVTLDKNGEAWVKLPDWIEPLNKEFQYQLTPIRKAAPNLHIAQEISENKFKIAGGIANMKVSWQITGIRQDAYARTHRVQVEVDKDESEKGTYLHPIEHGAAEEKLAPIYQTIKKIQQQSKSKTAKSTNH